MKQILFITTFLISIFSIANKTPAEIYLDVQKLNSHKRVLYIAAHPDDENTRALAYFSLGEKAETAYLSLTRGDGGQNLIGNELSEDLGVLRTQELLAARSHDGAKQFFSRAVDFGYSKSASESLELWGKDEILSDVVLVIRKFQPDVIITRFPPDKRGGHGHHTASAMLAIEGFEKAADPNYLPEQVKEFGTWQTTSIYWNSSIWWDKEIDEKAKNNPKYLVQDIGGYSSLLGMSYNEIGTIARSQHKCQGFGAILERGSRIEYFEHLGGVQLKDSFFEKTDRSWSSYVRGKQIEDNMDTLVNQFDFIHPENNVVYLIQVLDLLQEQPPSFVVEEKIKRCIQIIQDCMGLYVEVVADDYAFTQGDSVRLQLNLINRSNHEFIYEKIAINQDEVVFGPTKISANESHQQEMAIAFKDLNSTPYWLVNDFKNLFVPTDPKLIGDPENEATLKAAITVNLQTDFDIEVPVEFVWRDPSYGERRRKVVAAPALTVNFNQSIAITKGNEPTELRLQFHAFKEKVKTKVALSVPDGWKVNPSTIEIEIDEKHGEFFQDVTITPSKNATNGFLSVKNEVGAIMQSFTEIEYDHIPAQVIFKTAQLKCVQLDAKIVGEKIAYINGVEDAVPQAIEQLGYEVEVFEVEQLAALDLSAYQSVVLGIRIYNVHPEIKNYESKLFEYVKGGGNVIMQYNTASRSVRNAEFGPYPFKLSRNRVTEEDAAVTFLAPKHTVLNSPNKITKNDFEDWVQERGLYFAGEWDEKYTPILSWNDQGEDPKDGALIVAQYGEGTFTYTGISFFRELPKGVEGAYRLFANLLSQ